MKRVIYILGTSFSGSTLLNHLLDQQPGIRGLSEAHNWFRDSQAYCPKCKGRAMDCPNYQKFAGKGDFWNLQFAEYPDSHTLVASTKYPEASWGIVPKPDATVTCGVIILSKTPHSFAWSALRHNPENNPLRAMRSWYHTHKNILWSLDDAATGQRTTPWSATYTPPPISPRDVAVVTYQALATQPHETVEAICTHFGLKYTRPASLFTPSDTCMLGGNNALYAQAVADDAFFAQDSQYLDGKYRGKKGLVFLDEQWRGNRTFTAECQAAYNDPQLRKLLAVCEKIGYESV